MNFWRKKLLFNVLSLQLMFPTKCGFFAHLCEQSDSRYTLLYFRCCCCGRHYHRRRSLLPPPPPSSLSSSAFCWRRLLFLQIRILCWPFHLALFLPPMYSNTHTALNMFVFSNLVLVRALFIINMYRSKLKELIGQREKKS